MSMAATALPEFVAPGNEVVCIWRQANAAPFEFAGQILEISPDYTQARVQCSHDDSVVIVSTGDIVRLADQASAAEFSWGEEPAEAEVADAEYNEGVSWWQGQIVEAYSTQYEGGPWAANVLDISPDGTKLKVRFEDGSEEAIPIEYATATESEESQMPVTAKAMPAKAMPAPKAMAKAMPQAKGKAAPKAAPAAAAPSGFVVGQKVNAKYSDGQLYPATIAALNTNGTQAKVTWEDNSESVVEIGDIKRKRGRQPGTHVATAAAPASASNGGTADPLAQSAYSALKACGKRNLRNVAHMLSERERATLIEVLGTG